MHEKTNPFQDEASYHLLQNHPERWGGLFVGLTFVAIYNYVRGAQEEGETWRHSCLLLAWVSKVGRARKRSLRAFHVGVLSRAEGGWSVAEARM
jgi:hypothetical protein